MTVGPSPDKDYPEVKPVHAQQGWQEMTHNLGSGLPRALNRLNQFARDIRAVTAAPKRK